MLQLIMFFAPSFVATLIYENLRPGPHTMFRLLTLTGSFVLIINLCVYATVMYRGWAELPMDGDSLANVLFCVKYMGLSLAFAIVSAFLLAGLSFVSGVGKR